MGANKTDKRKHTPIMDIYIYIPIYMYIFIVHKDISELKFELRAQTSELEECGCLCYHGGVIRWVRLVI